MRVKQDCRFGRRPESAGVADEIETPGPSNRARAVYVHSTVVDLNEITPHLATRRPGARDPTPPTSIVSVVPAAHAERAHVIHQSQR